MPPRTVALIAAVCLTSGWLLASVLAPPVARVQALPEPTVVPRQSVAEALAPFAEQLQLKLRQAPQPPTPRRNPFAFGTRQRASQVSTLPGVPAPPVETRVAPPVSGPRFSLSGIGVSNTAQGLVHTAVLSDGNTVHLRKAGDAIGGFQVIEVNESSATLADAAGARYVLRLR